MARILVFILIAAFVLGSGACRQAPPDNLDARLAAITAPYGFNVVAWQLKEIIPELLRNFRPAREAENTTAVRQFFALNDNITRLRHNLLTAPADNATVIRDEIARLQAGKAALRAEVVKTLGSQIQQVLADEGIYNPFGVGRLAFPRVSFRLEKPLNVLIISPRSAISILKSRPLVRDLSEEDMHDIESRVDALDYSSVVVLPGGLGTYPSLVDDGYDLKFTIRLVAHEWLHQYLYFSPLGFLFLLDLAGIRIDYDIRILNETLADMVAAKISAEVYRRFYGPAPLDTTAFDCALISIRAQVEEYLRQGNIEAAERYMREQQRELVSQGYFIRKLNQAYLAFNGSYAEAVGCYTAGGAARITFMGATGDIGQDLARLRERSRNLGDFLRRVSRLTSVAGLRRAVE